MEQKVPPGLRPSCPTSPQPRTGLTNCPSREEAALGPRPQAASDFLAQTKLLPNTKAFLFLEYSLGSQEKCHCTFRDSEKWLHCSQKL